MHLTILHCSISDPNAHYYALAWAELIISSRVVPGWNNCYANSLYLFICFCHGINIRVTSVWIQPLNDLR